MILYAIITLILILLIGYLFGIIIVKIIDKKLTNIKLNVPAQDIIINYPSNIEKFENSNQNSNNESNSTENKYSKNKPIIKETFKFDSDYYDQMSKDSSVEGFSGKEDIFKGWDIEKKKTQVCHKNHEHNKNGKDTNCTYGLTNFSDPKDMSPVDYKIFILNYPNNMTLQDYINWLYCYIGREEQLPYNHLKNLEKLKAGKELIAEEGVLPPPGYYFPAQNAKDYFNKMYNETNEFNIAFPLNSTTGPMLGYNYNDYSEFVQNSDLFGRSGTIRNKDIYKKKNAKDLFNYVNPRDSNNINVDNQSQIYRMKNVEI
jgi:hypothetical protein